MRAWFVTAILLAVALAPVFDAPAELGEASHDVQPSSPLQATVFPSTGWTAGGQEITITGSGFLDLADRNVTDDGQTHQWAQTTADYSDEAGRWNAVAVDSNGHVHVVHIKDTSYQLRHSVYDGTGWSSSAIKNCGKTYCWDVHMVIDGNDELHVAYTTYTSSRETLEYMHHDGTTWTSTEVTRAPCLVRWASPLTRITTHTSPTPPTGNTAATGSVLLRMTEPVGPAKGSMWEATEVANRRSLSTGTTTSTSPTRTAAHRN